MAQSLSKIYIHLVFHIETSSPTIHHCDMKRIHAYIGQLINITGCHILKVGGTDNHIHILFLLSKDTCISHVVEEVKRNSSRWIKTINPHYNNFAWQHGYAAFSVGQSVVEKTIRYIEKQQEHHAKRSFKDEYIAFLKLYDVAYDENYVFSD